MASGATAQAAAAVVLEKARIVHTEYLRSVFSSVPVADDLLGGALAAVVVVAISILAVRLISATWSPPQEEERLAGQTALLAVTWLASSPAAGATLVPVCAPVRDAPIHGCGGFC